MSKKSLMGLVIGVLLVAACGSDDGANEKASVSTLTVEKIWVEPTSEGSTTSNVYFRVASPVDDILVSAAVSSFVADDAVVHQVLNRNGQKQDDIEFVGVPANTWIEFAPGSHYVQLEGLSVPLTVGQAVEVTLSFESGAVRTLNAPVLEKAPS